MIVRQYRLIADPGCYTVSPSAIDTYTDCPRKWGYRYICGLKPPSTEAAKEGSEVHGHIDRAYREKVLPPETKTGLIARALLIDLPWHTELESEATYFLDWSGRAFIQGRIDLLDYWDVSVSDYKTTGNLKYMKTAQKLQFNAQAIVYSAIGALKFGKTPTVRWRYITRVGKPQKRIIETIIEDLSIKINRLSEIAEYLTSLVFNQRDINAYPTNPRSCSKYGGCPFVPICDITAIQQITSQFWKG
jgi:CRISPR/Cas system-associated exonuclease Cas4 (RecB family)